MIRGCRQKFGLKPLAAENMKNFFKKLAAIACKFNIVFRRHETSNDEADTEFDFTLDGVCYTLYTKEIPPTNYGDKTLPGWEICGYNIHPASRKHPEKKEDVPIGLDAIAENLVDDVVLAHLQWRIKVEEEGYAYGSLDGRRRAAAQAAFEACDFDFELAECSGWEFDGSDTFRRPVFIEQGQGPSKKITFYVEFKPGSEEVFSQGTSE